MPPERRESCKLHEAQIDGMSKNIHEIKKMLLGNGVIGVAEMARRSFEEEIERVDYEHFEDRYDDDGQPSYE